MCMSLYFFCVDLCQQFFGLDQQYDEYDQIGVDVFECWEYDVEEWFGYVDQ